MKQSEKNTLGKFLQMINICFLLGFFGEEDWQAKNCEFNFLKTICPIAAGLYRQIQFTVQLRKLNSPSHPAVAADVNQNLIFGKYLLPCIKDEKDKQVITHKYKTQIKM